MKRYLLSAIILLMLGCKKKETPGELLTESFPQRVILVMENPNDDLFYDYLNSQLGIVRRAKVDKNDDAVKYLFNAANAHETVWIAHVEGNNIYFQLSGDANRYITAAPNRLSDEYLLVSTAKGTEQAHLFKRHHIAFQDGVRIVAMESVMYPKHFLSREGVAGENNAVKLVEKADAKDAAKLRWYGRQM